MGGNSPAHHPSPSPAPAAPECVRNLKVCEVQHLWSLIHVPPLSWSLFYTRAVTRHAFMANKNAFPWAQSGRELSTGKLQAVRVRSSVQGCVHPWPGRMGEQ